MNIIYKFSTLCTIAMLVCLMGQKKTVYPKHKHTDSLPAMQGDIISVSYCDLVSNPTKYDRKIIATEAIEIINIAQVLDGGEPFLYSPKCDKSDSTWILVDVYESFIDPTSDTSKEIEKVVLKAKEKRDEQSARVKVLIVGRFFAPKSKGGYGHLDWARFKLVANKIEQVEEVPEETPWPLGYKRVN